MISSTCRAFCVAPHHLTARSMISDTGIKSYHILPQLFHGLPFLSSRNGKAAEFVKYSTPTAVWVRVHDSDNSDLLNKQRLP
ncbi:hypothetical protein F2Q70_00042660 [Brassica cretica]|uniref:Uncharacterized protein n=1 Tax=Brassica cretica TaxID=69181 RepID=A0A8S9KIF9_BRACR|nr:hypothetical protein F2Q70_00042660 [Brassica cretica]